MKVDDARPVSARLLDTPRPDVTQPVYLHAPKSPAQRSSKLNWKRLAIALGLTGLAASPLPFLSSVGAHIAVMVLLAFGTVQIRSVGTKGVTAAIDVDTVVAEADDSFEAGADEAGDEELTIRSQAAAGPLGETDVEPAAFSEAIRDDVSAPGGLGGTGGDNFLGGLGSGGGSGRGKGGGGVADGLGEGGGAGFGGTDLFNVKGRGKKFVYVIDRSHSMNTNVAWEAAVTELLKSLSKLPIGMQFQVVFYNEEPVVLDLGQRRDGLIRLTDESRSQAEKRIRNTQPGGGTNHEKALRRALELRPDVIFLLTDADDADVEMINDLTRANRRIRSQQATIHVIQFYHEGSPNRAIKMLADKNKGTYNEINTLKFRDMDE